MIPGEIFTGFAEFLGIVSVNDFWLPIGLITCEGVRVVKRVHTLFRRSAQARYGPQGSGRSAGGSAREKR